MPYYRCQYKPNRGWKIQKNQQDTRQHRTNTQIQKQQLCRISKYQTVQQLRSFSHSDTPFPDISILFHFPQLAREFNTNLSSHIQHQQQSSTTTSQQHTLSTTPTLISTHDIYTFQREQQESLLALPLQQHYSNNQHLNIIDLTTSPNIDTTTTTTTNNNTTTNTTTTDIITTNNNNQNNNDLTTKQTSLLKPIDYETSSSSSHSSSSLSYNPNHIIDTNDQTTTTDTVTTNTTTNTTTLTSSTYLLIDTSFLPTGDVIQGAYDDYIDQIQQEHNENQQQEQVRTTSRDNNNDVIIYNQDNIATTTTPLSTPHDDDDDDDNDNNNKNQYQDQSQQNVQQSTTQYEQTTTIAIAETETIPILSEELSPSSLTTPTQSLPLYKNSTVSCFSLTTLTEICQFIQPQSIIVFDIDDTLITSMIQTQFTTSYGVDLFNTTIKSIPTLYNFRSYLAQQFTQSKRLFKLSEPELTTIIQQLQSLQNVKIFCLTARDESLTTLTHTTLQSLGLQFQSLCPTLLIDGIYTTQFDPNITYSISNGVVFTNGHHKGFILFDLLQRGIFHREKVTKILPQHEFENNITPLTSFGLQQPLLTLPTKSISTQPHHDIETNIHSLIIDDDDDNTNNNNQDCDRDINNDSTTSITTIQQLPTSPLYLNDEKHTEIDITDITYNKQDNTHYITYNYITDIETPIEQLWMLDDQLGVIQQVVEIFTATNGCTFQSISGLYQQQLLPKQHQHYYQQPSSLQPSPLTFSIPQYSRFQIPIVICCQYVRHAKELTAIKTNLEQQIEDLNVLINSTQLQLLQSMSTTNNTLSSLSVPSTPNHQHLSPISTRLSIDDSTSRQKNQQQHDDDDDDNDTTSNDNSTISDYTIIQSQQPTLIEISLSLQDLIEVQIHTFILYHAKLYTQNQQRQQQQQKLQSITNNDEIVSFHDIITTFKLDKYPTILDYLESNLTTSSTTNTTITTSTTNNNNNNHHHHHHHHSHLPDAIAYEILCNHHLNPLLTTHNSPHHHHHHKHHGNNNNNNNHHHSSSHFQSQHKSKQHHTKRSNQDSNVNSHNNNKQHHNYKISNHHQQQSQHHHHHHTLPKNHTNSTTTSSSPSLSRMNTNHETFSNNNNNNNNAFSRSNMNQQQSSDSTISTTTSNYNKKRASVDGSYTSSNNSKYSNRYHNQQQQQQSSTPFYPRSQNPQQ